MFWAALGISSTEKEGREAVTEEEEGAAVWLDEHDVPASLPRAIVNAMADAAVGAAGAHLSLIDGPAPAR